MFENRINAFVIPPIGTPPFRFLNMPQALEGQPSQTSPSQVPIADIYQAARKRAEEDLELDKLFNPEYYDYEI